MTSKTSMPGGMGESPLKGESKPAVPPKKGAKHSFEWEPLITESMTDSALGDKYIKEKTSGKPRPNRKGPGRPEEGGDRPEESPGGLSANGEGGGIEKPPPGLDQPAEAGGDRPRDLDRPANTGGDRSKQEKQPEKAAEKVEEEPGGSGSTPVIVTSDVSNNEIESLTGGRGGLTWQAN